MTDIIRRTEGLLRGVAPEWTVQRVVTRGTSRFLDGQLRGAMRYGVRLGSHLPNIQADNTAELAQAASAKSQMLVTRSLTNDWLPGSLVRVAGREMHVVFDVERQANTLVLEGQLAATYATGERVVLHGEPFKIAGPVPAGATEIPVRGRYPVLPGDRLWIQADPNLLLSGVDYRVDRLFQPYTRSLALYNSSVVLAEPIPRALEIDDVVYLRVLPGYRSEPVDTPVTWRSAEPFGPFVLDYRSGRFTDQADPDETLAVEQLRYDDQPADASAPLPRVMAKNSPVIRCTISRTAPLFWNVLRGTVTYRAGWLVLRADDRGRCTVWTDLVPEWQGPARWSARVRYAAASPIAVIYRFWPDPQVVLPGGSGGQLGNVALELPGRANRLTLSITGQPGAELEMADLQYDGRDPGWVQRYGATDEVMRLRYSLAADVTGPTDWQAGSLQAKPYFQCIADLRTRLDSGRRLDGGSLLL
jgi:hypothetical protein